MKKTIFLTIAYIFLLHSFAFPDNTFTFRKYSVDNGLSENTVGAILQDNKGFMWFGTKEGLNRFDGNEFKQYKNDPNDPFSIGNNYVSAIFQVPDGNLWVGTDMGIYIMDYETERFTHFTLRTNQGEEIQTSVTKICQENDSIYWIGTWGQGVFYYNTSSEKLTHYQEGTDEYSIHSNTVWVVYKDHSGSIWAGTREGLSRYNRETNRFFTYTELQNGGRLKDNEILSIYEDSDGDLWAGTWGGGLIRFNKTTHTFTIFMDGERSPMVSHIRSIFEYDKNQLLIGADDGLYLFDKTTGKETRIDNTLDPYSLSDQNVYSIYKDRENGIWIGTYFGGLNYLPPHSSSIRHYYPTARPNSMSGKAVSQFCEDEKGNIWIATEDGGINYFEPQSGNFTTYLPKEKQNSLSYHNIHALILDEHNLWIGTFSRGLDVLDLRTKTFRNYSYNGNDSTTIKDSCIFSLYKDSRNNIYVGTPFGLQIYNREKDNFTHIKEINEFIYDITEDHQGYLWLASYSNGAYRYDYRTQKWKNYLHDPNNPSSVNFNKLVSVRLDEKQRLWFTSEGRGVCKYNYETDDFTTIDPGNGLASSVAYGVLDDRYGNIWVSTNSGISQIDLNTMEVKTYTEGDGMQSNQFNYRSFYKASNGLFYFGGVNGFNIFNPEDLTNNKSIPPIHITRIELLNDDNPEELPISDKLVLKYNESSLRIGFVSLSYVAPYKNKFSYILEGMSDRWINIESQKTVSFINLPPGNYTLRIKGSNNDGIWNEEGTSMEITVLPPFWLTTPAFITYITTLLLTIFLIIRYYLKQEKKKQQQRLEDFKQKKEKELYDMKIGFFTDIAHEIRTPLSLIKAPLESIILSEDGTNETKNNLSVIEKNTDRLMELINQLLDFRKVENQSFELTNAVVDVKEIVDSIIFRFRKSAARNKLNLITEITEEKVNTYTDKEALTKVISNLLTNALKYSESQIIVRLTTNGKQITIEVEDDGIGIPPEKSEKIFEPFYQVNSNRAAAKKEGTGLGLALVKRLVKRMNGDISVSNTGNGALFALTLPVLKQGVDYNYVQEELLGEEAGTPGTMNGYPDETEIIKEKKQLLVVEDNKDLREFLKQNLSATYEVYATTDGISALQLLEKQNVDIIVSDIVMPEMDGIEFTNHLRNNELYSHIPVILLSAKTALETKIKGLETGADIYMEKPFSINHLKAQLSSILENRKRIIDKFTKYPLTSFELDGANKKDTDFISKINDVIEENMADPDFSIEKLAAMMAMSRSNLQRKLKGITNIPPNDYIRVIKLKRAAAFLNSGKYQVNEVCYLVGYNNASYFAKSFNKQFGMLPKDFVKSIQKEKTT